MEIRFRIGYRAVEGAGKGIGRGLVLNLRMENLNGEESIIDI